MVEIKSNLRLSEVEILLLVLRVFFNIERHCLSNSLGFMGNINPLSCLVSSFVKEVPGHTCCTNDY